MLIYAAAFAMVLLLLGQDLTKIQADIQEGNFGEARQLLTVEIRAHPQNAAAYNLLGICLTELREPSLADQAFRAGLKLTPDSLPLLENLGLLRYREADYGDAKSYLIMALAAGSQNVGARFSLAASKLRTGEPDAALADLKALEPALGQSHEYWEERGRAETLNNPASAEISFAKALALFPGSIPALDGASDAALKQGQDEKALAIMIRAHQLAPEDSVTTLRFAEVCIRRDLGIDAKLALESLHKREPRNAAALFLLARSNISVQNWDQASRLFQDFLRLMPAYAPAYFALGWIDLRLNKPTEARLKLERCLQLDPSLVDARFELAQLQLEDGDIAAAESNLGLVLKTNPNHSKANTSLGDIRLRRGDFVNAATFFQTALHADPNLATAHYKLAAILAREGQAAQAAKERNLAVNLAAKEKRDSRTQLRLVTPTSKENE